MHYIGPNEDQDVSCLPIWTLDDFKVHATCMPSVSPDPLIAQVLPRQGMNTCALDVCLVLERFMLVGLNRCDQMEPPKCVAYQKRAF